MTEAMGSNADAWAEIQANEVRLWVGQPVLGLWCPTCNLPSGWEAPVQRDPAEPPSSWFRGCTANEAHRIEGGRNGV